jgi:hypothetical protein
MLGQVIWPWPVPHKDFKIVRKTPVHDFGFLDSMYGSPFSSEILKYTSLRKLVIFALVNASDATLRLLFSWEVRDESFIVP